MTLLTDSQQFTVYIGFFLLIIGIIGNGINILIFFKVRTYRQTPCTFYFLIESISNMIYILLNITLRILNIGYGIDIIAALSIWCKFRQFLLVTPGIFSMNLSCLAAIDQFLTTSKNVSVRHFSRIEFAHRIVILSLIFWCVHGIPIFVFYNISYPTKICMNTNAGYDIYIVFYLLGLICAIPILIMILFGWLTYRNVCQIKRLNALQVDRQLIRMTFTHVILSVISLLPFGIYQTYARLTKTVFKDSDRQMKEYFTSTVLSMVTYLYFVGNCYIFLISSRSFRQKTRHQLFPWCQ
ncbi:unnamed protein product [Adineta ricciae]|uniref:G-protein coupled receptors family 1 profile domain-containing protein n=1 Tax=Adineta ricciae TaxID=249248 RepID=A0A815IYP0_ADIRI|nr:unnamed protein product [Adineta ricciae]CAF1451227.1 unnamed protein product [Adineta ricciae]